MKKLFKNKRYFTIYLVISNNPKACTAFINANDSVAIPVVAERKITIFMCIAKT